MSLTHRVDSGSKDLFLSVVYPDTLMKPKKASIIAPHIMSLSSNKYNELNKFILISYKIFGVMGVCLGFLYLLFWGPFDTMHCEKELMVMLK